MSFALPAALAALAAVPLLLAAYLWQLRRARSRAVRYSDLALLRSILPPRSRWRRHVAPALLLAAVAALALAAARPRTDVTISVGRTSIILALDVSRSMCATDVEPNRLTVAQQAAARFVEAQPDDMRIGLVAFSGAAQLIVPPTTDGEQLRAAIETLTTARGTAIGSAMLTSIDAIAEINPDVAPAGSVGGAGATAGSGATPATGPGADPGPRAPTGPPPAGAYAPDIVVLLTDGANTRGVEPLDAAPLAAERRVRVYTIGFGTTQPAAMVCSQPQLGGDAFGDSFGGPGSFGTFDGVDTSSAAPRSYLVIDEPTLQAVAERTGGQYYRAESADQLMGVFDDLPRDVARQRAEREITMGFTIAGAVLLLGALVASHRFSPRL